MHLCDTGSPWDHVGRAESVLRFLAEACCWPAGQVEISPSATSGLAFILMACANTLEQAAREAEERPSA
ncbi:hypothetical protein [Nitratidesulfovibrio termitidis]|uniref:hypothetical protein n=1 Tax=Nitratidesulfovibrio termitidis TaxID=42252 RepID=UPI00040FA8C1|nr:hypothetical protein [Nitratidesulfovibrio termitidis]